MERTLREKFKLPIDAHNKINNYVAEQCEQIADDFAIGFAEWSSFYREKNRNHKLDMLHAKSKYDESYTTQELLEIYKKRKGL
jgi:transcription initiation factor TFIID subunit TAF12